MSRLLSALLVALVVCPLAVRAQPPGDDDRDLVAPLNLVHVEGRASLVRDGQSEALDAAMPLVEGDRVRTDDGRVQAVWPDGNVLFLDTTTVVDVVSTGTLRLVGGRVRLSARANAPARAPWLVRVETGRAALVVKQVGDFLVTAGPTDTTIAVLRGSATAEAAEGSMPVATGESVHVTTTRPGYPEPIRTGVDDEFDRFVTERLGYAPTPTTTYLPDTLQGSASVFESYGSWETEPSYGYVWYPRVDTGWRPYYQGSWRRVGRFGWTWIGVDPFAWPTHYYGRWGFGSRGWYWIPGNVWGPAWVSWGTGPGYVGWCPLGWNDQPVFSFSMFAGGSYVSLSRGPYSYGGWNDPWRGWTVLPSARFRDRSPVWRSHVDRTAIPRADLTAFVNSRRPPSPRAGGFGVGDPRQWRGSDQPGRVAVPRYPPAGGAIRGDDVPDRRGPGVAVPRATPSRADEPYRRAAPYLTRPQRTQPPSGSVPDGSSSSRTPRVWRAPDPSVAPPLDDNGARRRAYDAPRPTPADRYQAPSRRDYGGESAPSSRGMDAPYAAPRRAPERTAPPSYSSGGGGGDRSARPRGGDGATSRSGGAGQGSGGRATGGGGGGHRRPPR